MLPGPARTRPFTSEINDAVVGHQIYRGRHYGRPGGGEEAEREIRFAGPRGAAEEGRGAAEGDEVP